MIASLLTRGLPKYNRHHWKWNHDASSAPKMHSAINYSKNKGVNKKKTPLELEIHQNISDSSYWAGSLFGGHDQLGMPSVAPQPILA